MKQAGQPALGVGPCRRAEFAEDPVLRLCPERPRHAQQSFPLPREPHCLDPPVRIRHTFDYELAGGSPLLGVRGTVIITHGRARRRMIAYACDVAATMARARVPELIGEALRPTADARAEPAAVAPGVPNAEEAS